MSNIYNYIPETVSRLFLKFLNNYRFTGLTVQGPLNGKYLMCLERRSSVSTYKSRFCLALANNFPHQVFACKDSSQSQQCYNYKSKGIYYTTPLLTSKLGFCKIFQNKNFLKYHVMPFIRGLQLLCYAMPTIHRNELNWCL